MRIPRASMNDRTYGTLELGDFLTLAARHVQTIPGRQRMLQLRPSVSRSDIQRELDDERNNQYLSIDDIEPNKQGGYRAKREFALRGCRNETHLYEEREKH